MESSRIALMAGLAVSTVQNASLGLLLATVTRAFVGSVSQQSMKTPLSSALQERILLCSRQRLEASYPNIVVRIRFTADAMGIIFFPPNSRVGIALQDWKARRSYFPVFVYYASSSLLLSVCGRLSDDPGRRIILFRGTSTKRSGIPDCCQTRTGRVIKRSRKHKAAAPRSRV